MRGGAAAGLPPGVSSRSVSAARSIAAADAPLNEWRCYPLAFTVESGSLETRVYWPGKASVAVAEILLWEIVR